RDNVVVWKTNGTPERTYPIGHNSLADDQYVSFDKVIVAKDRFYLFLSQDITGTELWVSNGTTSGTHITRDIYAVTKDAEPTSLTAGLGGVYFSTRNAGVWLRRDDTGTLVQLLTRTQFVGNAFFGKLNGVQIIAGQHGIWKTDGTKAGTKLVFSDP